MKNPWQVIQIPQHEFNVRLVSDTHPLRLYWGRDVRGQYLFVVQLSLEAMPDRNKLPEISGINVIAIKAPDCVRLVLVLNETEDWEIFKALCTDLIHASKTASSDISAAAVLALRLSRWCKLLKRDRKHIMSPEAVKGLIGELLFLETVLAPRFGWDFSMSFWKGPMGSPQDFAVHDTAVEVKCQSGISRPYVQISSIEQLEAQLPNLYLIVYTLATAEHDTNREFSLNSLIDRIRLALDAASEMSRELFESLLFQAGYIRLDSYDDPCFWCVATHIFHVTDKFPRLTTALIPDGISRATYQISLDACAPFSSELRFVDTKEESL